MVVFRCKEDSTPSILVHNINGSPSAKKGTEDIRLSVGCCSEEGAVGVAVQGIDVCTPVRVKG